MHGMKLFHLLMKSDKGKDIQIDNLLKNFMKTSGTFCWWTFDMTMTERHVSSRVLFIP